MSAEPRNAATDALDALLPQWGDRDRVLAEWMTWFADGFTREDRRRLVGLPPVDAAQYLDHHMTWFGMGEQDPSFAVAEWIAVRSERLSLGRVQVSFGEAFAAEMLVVSRWNADVTAFEKTVLFDADDIEAALGELDRLYAEIEAGKL